jgi:orotate phosphoribosyltransferase
MADESASALLREVGALMDGHFRLSSGRHSPVFVEKFRLLENPPATERLCKLIAERFRDDGPQLVAGPTTGGIIISYEVARQLALRGIFAEKADGASGREFQRGFEIAPGERTLIVDDVLTTGGSVREVIEAARRAGGEPIGVGVLVDRSGGRTDFGLPFFACLELDLPTYDEAACPLCQAAAPLTVT